MGSNTVCFPADSPFLSELEEGRHGLTISVTSNTITVQKDGSEVKYLFSDDPLSNGALNFMRKVKEYAMEKAPEPPPGTSPVFYLGVNRQKVDFGFNTGEVITDVCEMDITAAYWYIARKLGYISQEIFTEGLEKEKMTRLKALGNLGTSKKVFYKKPGKGQPVELIETVETEKTRRQWFHICEQTGVFMQENAEKAGPDEFYFFWVDAFFCSNAAAVILKEEIGKQGFAVKRTEMKSLSFKSDAAGKYIEARDRRGYVKKFFVGDNARDIFARTFETLSH